MMKTAFIAHGFNSRNHSMWVRDLGSRLEAANISVQPIWYGWKHLLRIRSTTSREAKRLAALELNNGVGIGHSNGCALLLEAANLGAGLDHLLFINPALSPRVVFPPNISRVDVFYSSDDMAVVAGKIWATYNPLRLVGWSSPWGEMGRVGARTTDPRVYNWPLGNLGHSGALRWDRLYNLSNQLINLIEHHDESRANQ